MSLKEKFILISKKNKIKILLVGKKFKAGRNHSGKITVRHRGSKLKKKFRIIDLYRALWHMPMFLKKFEYDPNRRTLLSLIMYSNGVYSYHISIENLKINIKLMNGLNIRYINGNSTLILKIKKNFSISCLEIVPFTYFKLLKSSGAHGKIVKKGKLSSVIKLKSGKLKKINNYCMATLGKVLNFNYYLKRHKKASFFRLKGYRPFVRGVAMNPVDHPYGGGEGKKSKKSILMSPWGKIMRFKKTKR